jgi:hypothetical protein
VRRYEIVPTEKGMLVGVFHEEYDKEQYGRIVDMMPPELMENIEKADEILHFILNLVRNIANRNQNST